MQTTTNEILDLLGRQHEYELCESPSLRLEKYLQLDFIAGGNRLRQIQQVISSSKNSPRLYQERLFPNTIRLAARLESNLLINQAGGILENAGLCFDSFRGYPYVPGSALKGVSLHAAWNEWQESKDLELARRIVSVFGFPTGNTDLDEMIEGSDLGIPKHLSGTVSFLPAKPLVTAINKFKLTIDVCTSHHPAYYQGGQEPYDNEDPRPLFFPAVEAGTVFVFQLIPLPRSSEQVCQDARHWLLQAICDLGLGAKTAAGYGWFSFDEKTSADYLQQEAQYEQKRVEQKAEQERKRQEAEQKAIDDAKKAAEEEEEAKKTAGMTPEEKLDHEFKKMKDKPFELLLSEFVAKGKKAMSPERKAAVVRVLKGKRNDFWEKIKNSPRTKGSPNWPHIVSEVRALHRQLYNGEKMP